MERIADGFTLAEAPLVTADGILLVADALGGGVRRFDGDGLELEPLLDRRRGIGGMGLLTDGSVVVSGRDLSVVRPDGTTEVVTGLLEDGTSYNDLAVTGGGTVLAGMLTCQPFAGGPHRRPRRLRLELLLLAGSRSPRRHHRDRRVPPRARLTRRGGGWPWPSSSTTTSSTHRTRRRQPGS